MIAFPLNELRASGLIQAAVIALILGLKFHTVPATAPALWWVWLPTAYACLAAVVPWTLARPLDEELRPSYALWLGLITILPVGIAAWLLHGTPYEYESRALWGIVGLWGVYLCATVVRAIRG